MRTVLMLHAACDAIAANLLGDECGRADERLWLSTVIRSSVVRGDEFRRYLRPAHPALLRIRMPFEGPAVRRAAKLKDAVYFLDVDSAASTGASVSVLEEERTSTTLRCVVDWLMSLREGDPVMLRRISRVSLPDAARHAQAWHDRMQANAVRVPAVRPDGIGAVPRGGILGIDIEADGLLLGMGRSRPLSGDEPGHGLVQDYLSLESGRRWVRLMDAAALDRESWAMGHCVGHGSYDHGVASGRTVILSLRDGDTSLCTVEWTPSIRSLAQAKGPRNRRVHEDAVGDLLALLDDLEPASSPFQDLSMNGLREVRGHDGRVTFERIPEGEEAQRPFMPVFHDQYPFFGHQGPGLFRTPLDMIVDWHRHAMERTMRMLQEHMLIYRPIHHQATGVVTTGSGVTADPRHKRPRKAKALAWDRSARDWSVDHLRSVASNPDLAAHDRDKARTRLKMLLSPAPGRARADALRPGVRPAARAG